MSEKLARVMGFWALLVYGVGDILGAGIYGLVGRAAGQMGNAVWLAFATSMMAAVLTGLSYASLGSRYPRAAGTAFILLKAFRSEFLAYVVGLGVLASGLTSMATASRVFSGYLQSFLGFGSVEWLAIFFLLFLTAINLRGIRESTWLNVLCTLIEVSGLLLIIVVGVRFLGGVNYFETPHVDGGESGLSFSLCFQGAVLVFYSFVGFEDMLNVTEEVKDPQKTFPRALIGAVMVSTVIYVLISLVAVSVVPFSELGQSKQPLVDVVRVAAPWFPPSVFSVISMFAVANTALLNFIMGSRLLYGMSNEGLLPSRLGLVHPIRKTPHAAIGVVFTVVVALTLFGDVSSLAKATSVLLLLSFALMNLSLVILKRRSTEPRGEFEIPYFVPVGGLVVCLTMLFHAKVPELKIAGALLLIACLLFSLRKKRCS